MSKAHIKMLSFLALHVLFFLAAPDIYFSQAKPVGERNAIPLSSALSEEPQSAKIEKVEASSSLLGDASVTSPSQLSSCASEDLYVVKQNGSTEAVSFEKVGSEKFRSAVFTDL